MKIFQKKKEMNMIQPQTNRLEFYYTTIICQDLLLKDNYKTIFELPTVNKIVLNTTSNSYALDKKNMVPALLALELVTGQKAKFTAAKKSLAPFKIREKQVIGCKVTLRKNRLYNFLNILNSLVFPRVRDFPGISVKSFDKFGNFSLGFTNLLLFPQLENHFEFFQNFRGVNINFFINKSQKKRKISRIFYSAYQLPVLK